ncbi:hypothetical protein B566_EDAN012932 [Ephemera danica]|nr:hypothetical protein B566_EDAN012932 [Ephemera danica]
MKNVSVISPGAVPLGNPIQMECHFDLEGDQLYAVKWYKGKKEFYRFIPNEVPQSKVFPLPGVNVDLSQSDKHRVTISDATFNLSGRYRCEVSADLSFDTALVTTSIDVVGEYMQICQIYINNLLIITNWNTKFV